MKIYVRAIKFTNYRSQSTTLGSTREIAGRTRNLRDEKTKQLKSKQTNESLTTQFLPNFFFLFHRYWKTQGPAGFRAPDLKVQRQSSYL